MVTARIHIPAHLPNVNFFIHSVQSTCVQHVLFCGFIGRIVYLLVLIFRCDNNICIRKTYQCDHENDCGDGSDERSCTYGTCSSSDFTCNNKQCIPQEYRCDLDKDCTDGSDEVGCTTTPSTCSPGQFQCSTTGRCIEQRLVCNKIDDCGDDSDEKDCNVNECDVFKPCQQHCKDTRNGFICSCDSGYRLENVTKCRDINECLDNTVNNCSHSCLNIPGHFKCLCNDNYKLEADRHTCKYIGKTPKPYLLFSDRYDIRKLSPDSKKYTSVLSDLTSAVALDYDYSEQRMYWSTNSPKGIKSAFFNGSDIRTVITDMKSRPDGIAIDWVGRNIYFCETQDGAIYVAKLNGFFLKKLADGLKEPRGMAVYPAKGILYRDDKNFVMHINMS